MSLSAGLLLRATSATVLLGTAGEYLAPGWPLAPALGVLVVVAAAWAAGFEPPVPLTRVLLGVLLAGLAVFVAACVAIAPAGPGVHGGAGPLGPSGMFRGPGALLAAFAAVAVAAGSRRGLVLALGGYAATAGAALYQLGPVRFGLSRTPLHEALAAADAAALRPVIDVVVLLAAWWAMHRLLGAMAGDGRRLISVTAEAGGRPVRSDA